MKEFNESIREPLYIIAIILLCILSGYLLFFDKTEEAIYDNSKIGQYEKIILERDNSIDSLLLLNTELDSMLKVARNKKETLKKNVNEKKISIRNINSDSDYVFIKRYLSTEYEPLF